MELRPGQIAISSMGCAELLLGAELSGKPVENRLIVERFTEPLQKLNFDQSAAVVYSSLRAHLQKEGALISPNDLIIASTVLAHQALLVTAKVGEFSRVPGLRVENWAT